jgi:hypothetical protein
LFPDEEVLGTSAEMSNELRALQARCLWNVVKALKTPVLRASQLVNIKGVTEGKWIPVIHTLLDEGELPLQKERAEQAQVLKLFRGLFYLCCFLFF